VDQALEATAELNGGFFTRAQALDRGWTDRELAKACRLGMLRHVRHGAYAPATTYDAATDVARHLVLARAALARQRGSVALTGVSAAAAHGLSVFGHDLTSADLVRLDAGSSRHEVRARHHVVADDIARHIELRDGVPVTSLARTVWEVAGRSSLEAGVATADSALRLYPQLADELAALAPVFASRPGSRRAREVMRLADGRAESPGESYSRVVFHRRGVPMPELQHPVTDADGRTIGTCDFYWREDHHVGEFDGKIKYGRLLRPGESPGDAVFREKRREDRIRARLLGMSRWVFADLSPTQVRDFVSRLNAERAQSRALYGRARTVVL
jgi:hypothetical protein